MSRRWVLTIKTEKQGNFPQGKGQMDAGRFPGQKDQQQTDSPPPQKPGFRMSCQMAASKCWDLSHIDFKPAFLQGQSHNVDRDVVCQMRPEANHPPHIAAQTEETCIWHERCTRRWLNILDKALRSYGMVPNEPIDVVTYCVLCSRVSKLPNTGHKGPSHSKTEQQTPSLNCAIRKWTLLFFFFKKKKKKAGSHYRKPSCRKNCDKNHQFLCG